MSIVISLAESLLLIMSYFLIVMSTCGYKFSHCAFGMCAYISSIRPTIHVSHMFQQILLDDMKVSEQLIDLVFYLLVLLGAYRQVIFHILDVYLFFFFLNFYFGGRMLISPSFLGK